MKSYQKVGAAAVLATGMAFSSQAQVRQETHIDEIVNTLKAELGSDTEIVVSTSDIATDADKAIMLMPFLMDEISTCDGDTGVTAVTVGGLSLSDLKAAADSNGGRLTLDARALVAAFEDANDKRFFEISPNIDTSEYSATGEQAHYFYKQMANEFEAQSGITVTTVTAIFEDPNIHCNVPIEEALPPEVLEQLRQQGFVVPEPGQ